MRPSELLGIRGAPVVALDFDMTAVVWLSENDPDPIEGLVLALAGGTDAPAV